MVENGLELVFARLNPRRRLLLCHVLGLVELAPPARQLARLRSNRARLAPTLPATTATGRKQDQISVSSVHPFELDHRRERGRERDGK